jgi:hypothetical protein
MLTRRHLVVSVLSLSAAGCAGQRQPMFQMRTSVEAYPLKKGTGIELLGIEVPHAPPENGSLNNTYYLWSIVQHRVMPQHAVIVVHHYLGPEIAWRSAEDKNGNSLPFLSRVRRVTSCTTTQCTFIEIFGAELPDAVLRAEQASGITVVFGSHAGLRKSIRVTPAQIQAQLAACDVRKL